MRSGRKTPFAAAFPRSLPLAILIVASGALVATPALAQLVSPPFADPSQTLSTLQTELHYTVDLGALPLRPRLIVEVEPDATHPDLELEIEIYDCTIGPGSCPTSTSDGACSNPGAPGTSSRWTIGTGALSAYYDLFTCCGGPQYTGTTCEVAVRPRAFGAAGKPATVDVTIRGETNVPTSTVEIEVDPIVAEISLPPSKDTTLYQANPNASNGLGESIWASTGTGTNALHGLLDFSVPASIPANVPVTDVRLELSVLAATPDATFTLHAVPDGPDWSEGVNDAVGDESAPPAPLVGPHASWSYRRWTPFLTNPAPWQTPGGDRGPVPLATATVSSTGRLVLRSTALFDHVVALQSGAATSDGFLLVPVSGSVRFGSGEAVLVAHEPRLVVEHRGAPIQTAWNVGTQTYFGERQNFRWIYDLENDHTVQARHGTTCVSLQPFTSEPFSNYTYQYLGDPGYRGLDCCVWQVGTSTGVTGTGQAIFYIGVDAGDPANLPTDLDGDGLRDVCDNCITVPNGPFAGSCLFGARQGQACSSDQECSGAPCSLSQEDLDRDEIGDACVPEPAAAAGVAVGLLGLGILCRRRLGRSR